MPVVRRGAVNGLLSAKFSAESFVGRSGTHARRYLTGRRSLPTAAAERDTSFCSRYFEQWMWCLGGWTERNTKSR
jgi:hypothetical protein